MKIPRISYSIRDTYMPYEIRGYRVISMRLLYAAVNIDTYENHTVFSRSGCSKARRICFKLVVFNYGFAS